MIYLGADEVVVANIPKRVPLKSGTSEGLHIVSLLFYYKLKFNDDFK